MATSFLQSFCSALERAEALPSYCSHFLNGSAAYTTFLPTIIYYRLNPADLTRGHQQIVFRQGRQILENGSIFYTGSLSFSFEDVGSSCQVPPRAPQRKSVA
jgi:hypothetical protein